MSTQSNSGSQACTVTTEHTLATISTAGSYLLVTDLDPLADGTTPDILELRVKEKVLAGSTSKQCLLATYVGDQGTEDVVKRGLPFDVVHEVVLTMKQTQGTGRTIDWSVRKIA